MCSSWLSLPLCFANKEKSIIKNILVFGTQPSIITVEVVATSRPPGTTYPPHLQMMPMDVLVNIVMPEGTEWHLDDFNMLMCFFHTFKGKHLQTTRPNTESDTTTYHLFKTFNWIPNNPNCNYQCDPNCL